ncbi:MAG: ABC transporter permease [Lachnospiraceae bacterium]|nr:ABC transporter permease [Lachnospiraceae bacterium]
MMKYEIKKVFSRTGGKVSIVLLVFILLLTCYFATSVSYTNENGEQESGYKAARTLRLAKKEWAGPLDEAKLRAVITENMRINALPEAQAKDVVSSNITYGRKQGFDDIRALLNYSFADGFREYDYYKADSLSIDQLENFYQNRITLLQDWLNGEAKDQFSESEKSYLLAQYEALETPFYYDYSYGWQQLFEFSPTIIMITLLILGYLVSGIFSSEFSLKADSVFYSSVYGRNKAVTAKIKAGVCITTVFYFINMLLYTAVVLLYLGADSVGNPVQISWTNWKTFYNLTFGQKYLLIATGGYIGCLFISLLTMFVSAKTKSGVLAVMVPFIIIFLPSFVGGIKSSVVGKILGLLPDRLLQVGTALNYFDLYSFGQKVVGAVPILFVVYGVLAAALLPVIYLVYKKY